VEKWLIPKVKNTSVCSVLKPWILIKNILLSKYFANEHIMN